MEENVKKSKKLQDSEPPSSESNERMPIYETRRMVLVPLSSSRKRGPFGWIQM